MPKDNAYRLMIFDFDGTLADTRNSILMTVQATLKKLDAPPADPSVVERLIGLSLNQTFAEAAGLSEEEIDEAVKVYRALYDGIALDTVSLFPLAAETLNELKKSGYRLAIASSKGRSAIMQILGRVGILDAFDTVLGDEPGIAKKPAPDAVLKILADLNYSADQALVIGDTVHDIRMGLSAGCSTCFITHGYGDDNDEPADIRIDSFLELIPSLETNQG